MAKWVVLFKFTDKGARDILGLGGQVASRRLEWLELTGSALTTICLTMGEYDMVAVGEGDAEAVAAFALLQAQLGFCRTTTMPAFDVEDTADLIARVEQHDIT
jgi:uncharacterized protein with GYD domain